MYTDDTSSAVLASRPILKTKRHKINNVSLNKSVTFSVVFTLVDHRKHEFTVENEVHLSFPIIQKIYKGNGRENSAQSSTLY